MLGLLHGHHDRATSTVKAPFTACFIGSSDGRIFASPIVTSASSLGKGLIDPWPESFVDGLLADAERRPDLGPRHSPGAAFTGEGEQGPVDAFVEIGQCGETSNAGILRIVDVVSASFDSRLDGGANGVEGGIQAVAT
jgi:hypothetical protein